MLWTKYFGSVTVCSSQLSIPLATTGNLIVGEYGVHMSRVQRYRATSLGGLLLLETGEERADVSDHFTAAFILTADLLRFIQRLQSRLKVIFVDTLPDILTEEESR